MNNIPDPFYLTLNEKQSSLWIKLKLQLNSMLQELREKNDSFLDAQSTATLRGQIAVLKNILDWDVERLPE